MCAATSPCDLNLQGNGSRPPPGVHGTARVRFSSDRRGQVLESLHCRAPLRLLFPRPSENDPPTAVVVTTSGGLVGGDRLDIRIDVGERCRALITSQAAEKVYRSQDQECGVEVSLCVEDRAALEWLPQETILFESARLRRRTRLDLQGDGEAMVGEMLVFGRVARGEHLTQGLVHDRWEVRRDGSLIWADALHMEGDLTSPLDHPAGFHGARAYATVIYTGPHAEDHLETSRGCLREIETVRMGTTTLPGLVVSRWLGREPHDLRKAFAGYWSQMRHRLWGLPQRLPRVFHI